MQRDPSVVVPRTTTTTTGYNRFPVELLQHILCFTDPEDIITLRKTCRYFLALTQDHHLWTAMYNRMRNTHPFSCSQSEFAALAIWQSERLLVGASKTEKLFRTFRYSIQHRIITDGQARKTGPLVALSFLSERFILSVDDTAVVYVWDISKLVSSAGAPSFPCARLALVGWDLVAYSMSTDHCTLYVVLSKDARAYIFSLSLPLSASDTDETKLSFRYIAYVDTRFNKVNSIDPDSCLVLLELSYTMIEVVDWRTQSRSSVALGQVEGGAPANYVLALRICGPYILCFRRWSIEAYPIPFQFLKPEIAMEQPLPMLHHTLTIMGSAMKISLSHVRCSRSPSGDVYSIGALAENYNQGTFHFLVHLQMTPKPSLSLRLLGANNGHTDQRIFAWGLGTTGLRGVWVREPNWNSDRYVVAFTTDLSRRPFDPNGARNERPPPFDVEVVSVVRSQNFSDDVTICAVSEFTGRIALGSRTGVITLV